MFKKVVLSLVLAAALPLGCATMTVQQSADTAEEAIDSACETAMSPAALALLTPADQKILGTACDGAGHLALSAQASIAASLAATDPQTQAQLNAEAQAQIDQLNTTLTTINGLVAKQKAAKK